MSTSPVRIDRLQAGLVAWVQSVHPGTTVVWAQSGFPRDTDTGLVFTLRVLAPPSEDPIGGGSRSTRLMPTRVTVQIEGATVGESVKLSVSGRSWEYEIEAGDDVEAVRDGLLAAIEAPTMVSAAFTAVGSDSIQIDATAVGDLHSVWSRGSADGLIDHTVDATTLCEVASADVRTYVEVQAWSYQLAPRLGAPAALSRLMQTRRLTTAVSTLGAYGLAVVGGPPAPIDLSALSGPAWQSRASISFYVSQLALYAEPVESIERVRGTLDLRDAVPDTTVSLDTGP